MANATRKLAAAALSLPIIAISAHAADKPVATEAKIQALQQQLETLQSQIADIKKSNEAQIADVKKKNDELAKQAEDSKKAQSGAAKVTLTNGRPTFTSADGQFTASIYANGQADYAYYMQGKEARSLSNGPDLSSGANIRRAQLGIQGKVFGDWSYNFLYDFGGAGTETPGKILYSYLQYDGLAPFSVRIGAFAPAYNVEDQTSSSQLMFLERSSPTNIIRNVAGSEGRLAIAAIYAGDEFFGSLAYSASKIAETSQYDEQSALVGRASYLVINDKESDAHLLVGGGFTHVMKLPDLAATNTVGTHTLTLSDIPELSVDDNSAKLISTGALNAGHFTALSGEVAGNYQNFYLQGSYNYMQVARAATNYTVYKSASSSSTVSARPESDKFSAWYVQASWVITGESKQYVPATGSFGLPKPAHPFSIKSGDIGAWEIAARFSDTDLNAHEDDPASLITGWTSAGVKTYSFINAVRGGEQKNITLGLNWYPNNTIRFQLDYMWIDVDRLASGTATTASLSTKQIGQDLQAVALRAQVAF